eukprot:360870-Chlamydomonas_euryale.AAC.2
MGCISSSPESEKANAASDAVQTVTGQPGSDQSAAGQTGCQPACKGGALIISGVAAADAARRGGGGASTSGGNAGPHLDDVGGDAGSRAAMPHSPGGGGAASAGGDASGGTGDGDAAAAACCGSRPNEVGGREESNKRVERAADCAATAQSTARDNAFAVALGGEDDPDAVRATLDKVPPSRPAPNRLYLTIADAWMARTLSCTGWATGDCCMLHGAQDMLHVVRDTLLGARNMMHGA